MLFNSIDFALFLPVVFVLYWFTSKNSRRIQNYIILISSYVFYGWWDWRFLILVLCSTLVDYFVGIRLSKEHKPGNRKFLLWISLMVNLGLLGIFKYYNFFISNFTEAFSILGYSLQSTTLNIILPVGISFYTFQTLSYTLDIYHRKIQPTHDFISFAAFVSFFPQLVAGPIERASKLLPQFRHNRSFNYHSATDGLRQMVWGLFKKVVIADNCGAFADMIFNNSNEYSGIALVLGAVMFAFQIYGDFSGYSDIAIGTSRLFGFDLSRNFAYPYFSRDIAEFWRRWHISLSTWFRDYVYIPLGGSKAGIWKNIRNIFIIFIVSGFWHGANWTFIIWGLLNAIYFLPIFLFKTHRNHLNVVAENSVLPSANETFRIFITFSLTTIAWIFFRAENLGHALSFVAGIFNPQHGFFTGIPKAGILLVTFSLVIFMIAIEWLGRHHEYALEKLIAPSPKILRWSYYSALIFIIGMFMQTNETPFIYFQF